MFISYSHSDRLFAANLASGLQAAGVHVWIDQGELRVGDSIIDRISNAISQADFFIALITENSVKSSWCQKELSLAASAQLQKPGIRVLPLRVGAVTMPSLDISRRSSKMSADLG
jgi:hypothetical protein